MGPATVLKISKGDQITWSAYSLYKSNDIDVSHTTYTNIGTIGAGGIESGTGIFGNGGGGITFMPLFQHLTGNQPKAYLRIVIVDEDGNELQDTYQLITNTADSYQHLETILEAEHSGYAVVYVANESRMDVYFDDFTLKHKKLIWQENNYYPYGMNLKPIDQEGSPNHRFTFSGKEEEESGYLDFHARQQDRQLARFMSADPLADQQGQVSWTPFHYTMNNPINRIDPDGRSSITLTGSQARRAFRRMRRQANKINPQNRLNRITQALGRKMDRLYRRGKRQEREWGFVIVQNRRGKIKARNVVHSPDEDDPNTARDESKTSIKLNFENLKKGDKVIGDFHTHPNDKTLLSESFESFSDGDIENFMATYHNNKSHGLKKKKDFDGYVKIMQGSDGRYAIAVENYRKAS